VGELFDLARSAAEGDGQPWATPKKAAPRMIKRWHRVAASSRPGRAPSQTPRRPPQRECVDASGQLKSLRKQGRDCPSQGDERDRHQTDVYSPGALALLAPIKIRSANSQRRR
jgi:hypothetical protein